MNERHDMSDHDLLIRNDEKLDMVLAHLNKINGRLGEGEKRMDCFDIQVASTKGWFKGALAAGGIGGVTGLWAIIKSYLGG